MGAGGLSPSTIRKAVFALRQCLSLAFTLTRYGGLFEDGSEAAVDRLDALLGGGAKTSDNVLQLDTRKLR